VRWIKQVGNIREHVLKHLETNAEISFELEIRANNDAGYNDTTQRTVSENASSLGATSSEFE